MNKNVKEHLAQLRGMASAFRMLNDNPSDLNDAIAEIRAAKETAVMIENKIANLSTILNNESK